MNLMSNLIEISLDNSNFYPNFMVAEPKPCDIDKI